MLQKCLNIGKLLCAFVALIVLAGEQAEGYSFASFIIIKLVLLFICACCYLLIDEIERWLEDD